MSLSLPSTHRVHTARAKEFAAQRWTSANSNGRRVMVYAAWHSLLWLVIANSVGVLLATMLLLPQVNSVLGEWTDGRSMPVHLNLQLYGWCSLPLVAFLFKVYGSDREPGRSGAARFSGCGLSLSASGHSLAGRSIQRQTLPRLGRIPSGSFPDGAFIPLANARLLVCERLEVRRKQNKPVRILKIGGLGLLLLVLFLIYVAANTAIYPPVNPDTGGPTGASQLESTLVIIAILLLLPFGLSSRKAPRSWQTTSAWLISPLNACCASASVGQM